MPVPERSKLKEKVRRLPEGPGVYLMKDRLGSVLYVGKAKNLKRRVSSYFQPSRRFRIEQPKIAAMLDLVTDFDIMEVRSESEALLFEGKLIKEWKPKYNTDFTDDKRFLHVRVDLTVALPRFRLVRFRTDDRSVYFGPFAHSGLLRRTLQEMRLKFGILLGDAQPQKREDGLWQLYDDARAEIYGHSNFITAEEYHQRVEQACGFLEGKSREWLSELEVLMNKAAEARDYERAAELRDIMVALRRTTERTRKFTHASILNADGRQPLDELREALSLKHVPRTMECFDISHISGSFCVASMVHFKDGRPDRKNYRRYQIKSFVGNDDFRAMCEVVGRRYARLKRENRPFPDLIVIDGGVGQVSAALRAFLEGGIEPPTLIGLAKKRETIIFSDGRPPMNLPGNHRGRLLLQHIRDEAHRHANSYNAELRRRKLRESVLDDFPGLGDKKRRALMGHFGSLDKLRKASIDDLQQVDGIGPKLAVKIREFFG
ncbi:excinuclease ABC subunit UvrC [Puniceicoccales bacterium CK1056]|uniref:Excinuclease ABC subunit UvrC n=1 Tax=Oceanipulchritudo coccoides TaxID=2706888 RepID=A0A6B2M107_9BACT|nr:excinuclease ABC subunit UvrC [Oceanipulchritudo coccoides]NDV62046.1 excinuclease ABC subunit UvrC [Oceanipulchritudo coccoides]